MIDIDATDTFYQQSIKYNTRQMIIIAGASLSEYSGHATGTESSRYDCAIENGRRPEPAG